MHTFYYVAALMALLIVAFAFYMTIVRPHVMRTGVPHFSPGDTAYLRYMVCGEECYIEGKVESIDEATGRVLFTSVYGSFETENLMVQQVWVDVGDLRTF